jgi:WD40 repeat protein
LVAVSAEPAVHVWPTNGSVKASVTKLAEKSHLVAVAPNARYAAGVLTAAQLTVWDLSGDKPFEHLTRPVGQVYRFAFSPDGTYLAACDRKNHVVLLGNVPAKTWVEIDMAEEIVESPSFSPNGKWLTVSSSRTVQVIDAVAGKEVARHSDQRNLFSYVTPAPNGASLAVLPGSFAMYPFQKLRVLSIPSWDEQKAVDVPTEHPRCLMYSPDGKSILIGGAFDLREWDPATGNVRRVIAGPAAAPVAFSPDGTRIASYCESGILYCSTATGKPVRPDLAAAGHHFPVHGVFMSSDGTVIATTSKQSSGSQGELLTWAAETGRPLASVRIQNSLNVASVAFLPGTSSIIGVRPDRLTPTIWDAVTGKEVRRFVSTEDRTGIETAKEWRLTGTGRQFVTYTSPTGKVPTKSYAVHWDVATGREVERIESGREKGAASIPLESPDGSWVLTRGTATHLKTKEAVEIVPLREAGYGAFDGSFSPDGRRVAVFRLVNPGSLRLFDLDARVKLADLATGSPRAVCFASDGRILAAVSNKEVTLWEAITAKPIGKRPTTGGGVAFFRNGRWVVTGQLDGTALVWDFTGTNRSPGNPVPATTEKDLAKLWAALAEADAAAAYTAGWELADRPAQTIPFLRARLQTAKPVDEATVKRLVESLDAPMFADREKAEAALRDVGELAVATLRKLQEAGLTAEQGARVKKILAAALDPVLPAGETLRQVRAVAVLERIGTAEAKKILTDLATGAPDARVTKEAKSTLERIAITKR